MATQSRLSQSPVSHHLGLLRAARLLKAQRQGKQVFYVVSDRHVADMLRGMTEHVAEPPPRPGLTIPRERRRRSPWLGVLHLAARRLRPVESVAGDWPRQ